MRSTLPRSPLALLFVCATTVQADDAVELG